MKAIVLIPLCFVSIFSFGQEPIEKFVTEVSPVTVSFNRGILLNIQGKLSYTFNRYLSLTARHNQEIAGGMMSAVVDPSEYSYRKNSLSDLTLGITLYRSQLPHPDPTEAPSRSWVHKLVQLETGFSYFKFANKRPDYYTYDTDDQGNYKIINSTNRLSASLGFSFILRENNIRDLNNVKLKRQHMFSAGAYYGLNYDLQGYVQKDGKSVSERAPKIYTFDRTGYYIRYNFRQQLNKHLYLGTDLFFSKMPYVNYETNPEMPFFFRGGERESSIQIYTGITIGWAF
jgi:hypothetical protein